jgi:hypothetical protein
MCDSSYTARYLGLYVGLGLNWLQGYVGFSSALQTQTVNLLSQWFNYVPSNAYRYQNPESNYGAGEYVGQVVMALALDGANSTGSHVSTVLAWRNNRLLPAIESGGYLYGGYYPDGWSYGARAVENLLLGSQALADAGLINNTPEQQWSDQVIQALISEQPSQNTIFDGGDWYTFPSPFPSSAISAQDLMAILASEANDPTMQSYANYILQHYSGQGSNDAWDMLFHNYSASASYWSSMPLSYLAQGTGLLTARSDWGSTPTWLAVEMGNLAPADHQTYTPGQVQIQRGADDLLINASAPGGYQSLQKSQYGNIVVVNDNGAGIQRWPGSMGVWYGTPGVVINAYEATSNFTYLYGNYAAAYSTQANPGGGGPVSELTRQVVYLNPNYVVVFDRVTTIQASFTKKQQWAFLNAPTVSGNSFTETVGSSTLFGQTFSTVPLTTTVTPTNVGGKTVQLLDTQNASPTASVRYVTAFQVAPSTTTQMVSTQQIVSTDSRMQGVQMGNQVVLFGTNGSVDLTTPVTYQISGSGAVQQMLTNLSPGHIYQVQADGTAVTTVTADSAGTISFSTTPSASGTQTIQVTLVG